MATETATNLRIGRGGESTFGDRRRRDVIDYVRRTSVVVYFLTFIFLYATIHVEFSQYLYYFFFALTLIVIGLWVEMDSEKEVIVFPRSALRLSEVPAQFLGGFLFAIVFIVLAVQLGSVSLRSGIGIPQFVSALTPQIIIVGGVETLMLIVYTRVVFMGTFVYPFLFAFSHTRIAALWTQGIFPAESFVFFAYAAAQAVIFMAIYIGRNVLPEPACWLCGPIAVAVYHGSINTVTLFSTMVGG